MNRVNLFPYPRHTVICAELVGMILAFIVIFSGCDSQSNSTANKSALGNDTLPPQGSPFEVAKRLQLQQDIPGAIAAYDELLSNDPIHIAALGNRAYLLESRGQFEAALRDYNVLMEVDPSNFAGLMRRANLLSALQRDSLALADFSLLLTHRPDDPELLNARGEVFARLGKAKDAILDFDAAGKLKKNWEKPLLNRAAAWFALGDFKAANSDYQSVLRLYPENSEATNGLGLIMQFGHDDPIGAEELYQKAILQNPKNAGAWYNLAYLEAGRGHSVKAIDDFGQAIRLDSGYVDAYLNRGLLQMQSNKPDLALVDFEFAANRRPRDGRTLLLLGWAQCQSHATMQGCLTLSRAKDLGAKDVDQLIRSYCK